MRKRFEMFILQQATLIRNCAAIFLLQSAETNLCPQTTEVRINRNLPVDGVDHSIGEQHMPDRKIK